MYNPISIIRRSEQNYLRSRVEEYNIHPIGALALSLIGRAGECNQDSLCMEMNVDKGRIAKTVACLEENGYLARQVNPHNKREKQLHLTEKGQEMAQIVKQIFNDWNEICFSGFTPEEKNQYMAYVERIAHNAANNRKEF